MIHPRTARAVVATLHPGTVDGRFFSSWSSMLTHEHQNCGHWAGEIIAESGPRVAATRTRVVQAFLAEPKYAAADWLLMIDSDMTYEPDVLCRLLGVAHGNDDTQADRAGNVSGGPLKVLGGLCFAGGHSTMYPTLYELVSTDGGPVTQPVADYPKDSLVKVGATGGALLLMHRDVLTDMAKPFPYGFGTTRDGLRNPTPWFVEGVNLKTGTSYGEDVAFCVNAQALGYGVWVDTSIKTGHRKIHELDEALWDDRSSKPQDVLMPPSNRAESRRNARAKAKVDEFGRTR